MSNHSGSYMLNSVLLLLEEYGFFKHLDRKKSKSFFLNKILGIGWNNDCNNGEILDQLGERLGFCYLCRDLAEEFARGDICKKCDEKLNALCQKRKLEASLKE